MPISTPCRRLRRSSPAAGRSGSITSGTSPGTTPSPNDASGGRCRTRREAWRGTTTPWGAAAPKGGTFTPPAGGPPPRPARRAALWSRDRISTESREYLSRLPVQHSVEGRALLVHGAPSDPGRYVLSAEQAQEELSTLFASPTEGPIFFGHTLVAGGFVRREDGGVAPVPAGEIRLPKGARALLNPGSVGQPRDRKRDASFLLYDTENRKVTRVRAPYDVEAARRKVLDAGLPPEFADRLRDGT